MKVLSISSDRKLFQAGSAVSLRAIEYGTLFDELHIIVFKRGIGNSRLQIAPNVWVYPTNSWSRWFYIFGAVRIGKRILSPNPAGWVIDAQDPFECGLAARKLSKRMKLPLHIQIHTDFLSPFFARTSFLNRVRVFMSRKTLARAGHVRVVSERIKNSLTRDRRFLISDSKISVLPIFTDLERFRLAQPGLNLQAKYPQWSFIILVVARLSPEKNVKFAIHILKELLKTYPKTGLVIVGEGPCRGQLVRETHWYGVSEHVAFEPWQNDLVSYYKTAQLFLQCSLYEGFGLALLEALASGCPAVSSDVGIAPQLLNHKGHSFVCPVNDLKAFVSVISQLIEDNQLRTFLATQIAPAAVLPFTQRKEQYLALYRQSIESALSLA